MFYRLGLIEKFGTGIMRINESYADSIVKPSFDLSENFIRIVLPVMQMGTYDLPRDEAMIYNLVKEETELTRAELDEKTGFNKAKTLRVINKLIDKNVIEKLGGGVGVTYRLR